MATALGLIFSVTSAFIYMNPGDPGCVGCPAYDQFLQTRRRERDFNLGMAGVTAVLLVGFASAAAETDHPTPGRTQSIPNNETTLKTRRPRKDRKVKK